MALASDMDLNKKKILLTGGNGFLGKYVYQKLLTFGANEENIFIPRTNTHDLRNRGVCEEVVQNKDIVIHLAAKVGGIGLNQIIPGEIFYHNIIMGVQLMEEARKANVKKFVVAGTICSYPKIVDIPFQEEDLWKGYPEETNAPYGLAKKMMLVQSQAYRQQYGTNTVHLLMVNLYGPGDDFNLKTSHVIPALIRKIAEAKKGGQDFINVWGTGKASREFLYVEDAAEGVVLATLKYDKGDPINLGAGNEISIKELTKLISELMGFKGKIRWDESKTDGQPRRCLNIEKAKREFGFAPKTNFIEGLTNTIEWYHRNIS